MTQRKVLKIADIERLENTTSFVGVAITAEVTTVGCCCSISSKFDCCIGTIIPTSV